MTEAQKYDMNPTLKKEVDLEETDIQDKDLVVSIGGDSTYLQSAGIINNSRVPLLGINSDPMIRTGFLANVSIESKFVHK
jgi:NAD kinase